jgi:hypothetical protein
LAVARKPGVGRAQTKEANAERPTPNVECREFPQTARFPGFLSSWFPDSLIWLNPEGQSSSPAERQIRPPPLSQHLREFAGSPHAWAALGRNLIPVVGIYAFGWSAALSVFSYWFDGLTALAAIVAAVVLRLLREMPANKNGRQSSFGAKIGIGVGTWLFLVVVVGLPYWIVLIPLHKVLLGSELRSELAHSPALWATFAALAVGHFWRAFQAGYDTMPENQLKQRARWDVYLLVLRACAMFLMASYSLYFVLVPLMALLLTYMEVWPGRVLGMVFGDPSRLWEYDPGGKTKR